MLESAAWITPLLLLPGVGILLMSTSARFESTHTEIHHHLSMEGAADCAKHTLLRARYLSTALVLQYVTIAALALSALSGAGTEFARLVPATVSTVLLGLGVLTLLTCAGTLVIESIITYRVIDEHAARIRGTGSK